MSKSFLMSKSSHPYVIAREAAARLLPGTQRLSVAELTQARECLNWVIEGLSHGIPINQGDDSNYDSEFHLDDHRRRMLRALLTEFSKPNTEPNNPAEFTVI